MGETSTDKPTADGADIIRGFLPTSPLVAHLGIELVELAPDRAVLSLPFRDEIVTIGSTVHGGAIATLIDTTAMAAAWSGAEPPENMRGTTVSLSVSFLAAANQVDLEAEARVVRRGRSLVFLEIDVRSPDGASLARGLATYKLG